MPESNEDKTAKEGLIATARHILRYVQFNSRAQDTLEGIAEWWLLQERIEEVVEQVSQAITWLVANGYLLEKLVSGGRILYKINPGKREEISAFLNSGDDTSSQT